MTEGAFGQLREGGGFCFGDVSAARRIRRRQLFLCVVLHNICLEKGDTITRDMDLAIDPKTGNRHERATVRELLQMRACDKIPDTDTRARLMREGLIDKLWLEKQGDGVS